MIDLNSKVAAFETDTVWGLGCIPHDKAGADKIYEIKGRDRSKPLILMSWSLEPILKYIKEIPSAAQVLIDKHFPGALTIIIKKSDLLPDFITSNKDTVGIRIPDHKGFQQLCKKIEGGVLATTSANFSNETPCASIEEVKSKLGNYVDYIHPTNEHPQNIASTVVLAIDKVKVLRQGSVIINP